MVKVEVEYIDYWNKVVSRGWFESPYESYDRTYEWILNELKKPESENMELTQHLRSGYRLRLKFDLPEITRAVNEYWENQSVSRTHIKKEIETFSYQGCQI